MAGDLKALLAQREELERQIRELQSSARAEAIAKIRELMSEHGLSFDDISARSSGTKVYRAGTKSSAAGTKVAAKYRDPETGTTWTGRGLKPKWMTTAIEGGKKPEDFLIEPA